MFRRELVNFQELKTEQSEKGRYYLTPNGRYPSITTVLSKQPEKLQSLANWRKRVGDEEANRISSRAARRGTSIHKMFENYITDNTLPDSTVMPSNLMMFNEMRKVVDANLSVIHALEAPMYSNELRVAGRCDLIGAWNGSTAIIDFKTSRKEKRKEYITDYFIQCSAYAIMFEELTSIVCSDIVIVMGCDETPYPLVFIEKTNDYKGLARQIINEYYENNG